jgi:hypothetical protein
MEITPAVIASGNTVKLTKPTVKSLFGVLMEITTADIAAGNTVKIVLFENLYI